MCFQHNGKGSSRCKRKSVTYETICQVCLQQGSDLGSYVGETGRSLYERSREHLADAKNRRSGSHIFKHWASAHPDLLRQPEFKFKVLRVHKTAMDRQIHEAIRIASHGILNVKCEYRQNQVKRLFVTLTSRELKEVKSCAAKLDRQMELATKCLIEKLDNNKNVSNFDFCSA